MTNNGKLFHIHRYGVYMYFDTHRDPLCLMELSKVHPASLALISQFHGYQVEHTSACLLLKKNNGRKSNSEKTFSLFKLILFSVFFGSLFDENDVSKTMAKL